MSQRVSERRVLVGTIRYWLAQGTGWYCSLLANAGYWLVLFGTGWRRVMICTVQYWLAQGTGLYCSALVTLAQGTGLYCSALVRPGYWLALFGTG